MNHIAFLSEWGNNLLDFTKKPATTHFIVTAIILSNENRIEAERIFEAVQRKYFQGNEKDPDLAGNDHTRRLEILDDLIEAPFQVFSLVVDKRQVSGQGLRYKGSFYKFLHGLADQELFRIFPDLQMVTGPVAADSFMEGFTKYVQQNHITNLFNEATFGFVNLPGDVVFRTAQFLAATLARCYDETVITDQRQLFADILQPKILTIKFWPDIFEPNLVSAQQAGYDVGLAELSIRLANDFLQRKAPALAPHIIDQVTCLSYLVFHFRHINPTRYISSFEIMEHIRARRGKNVSLHYFQTKVIAPLRDAGVLIASSSRGYKLPASEADLYDFVNHSNAIIEPMLSRIKKFRDQIAMATNGKLDVLEKQEYAVIRKVVD